MVVVDTVHRSMHGAEENSAAEMAKFIDACDTIQRHTGGTMLAVHHSGKSQAQGARGSNSLLGAVSTSLMIGKSGVVTLRVEKQKDAEPIEGDLRFNMLVVPRVDLRDIRCAGANRRAGHAQPHGADV